MTLPSTRTPHSSSSSESVWLSGDFATSGPTRDHGGMVLRAAATACCSLRPRRTSANSTVPPVVPSPPAAPRSLGVRLFRRRPHHRTGFPERLARCPRLGQGTPRIAEVGLDVPLRQRRLHRHSRLAPCPLASPGHGLKDPRPSRTPCQRAIAADPYYSRAQDYESEVPRDEAAAHRWRSAARAGRRSAR